MFFYKFIQLFIYKGLTLAAPVTFMHRMTFYAYAATAIHLNMDVGRAKVWPSVCDTGPTLN